MVTDIATNYTSPAGKEYTLAAGRIAGIHPASTVLDMGCGYGEGACNMAREFRCRVTGIDLSTENIDFARELAVSHAVSHLISFSAGDVTTLQEPEQPFDLVMAEGGVLSFLGRPRGLELASRLLAPRGWIHFSDLFLLSDSAPAEILTIFEHERYRYESEHSYRTLLRNAGFSIAMMCQVMPSGWDNYYAHMARRLEDDKGFFADKQIKLAFHKEIDVYYRLEASRYIGYLVCVARKMD